MFERDIHIYRFFFLAIVIIILFLFIQLVRNLPDEELSRSLFLIILLQIASGFAGFIGFKLYHARLKLFETIFKHSYDAISIIDKKGNYLWQNNKNIEFCGYDDSSYLGKKAYIWIDDFAIELCEELEKTDAFFGMFNVHTLYGSKEAFISAYKIADELGMTVAYVEFKRSAQQYRKIIEMVSHEKEQFMKLTQHDPLTEILNRRGFYESLNLRKITQGSIVFIDIDNFKRINDLQGHGVGDVVLQSVAKLLEEGTRSSDIVARFGGEEFVLWIDADTASAYDVCEKLRFAISTHAMNVTCSFGISVLDGSNIDEAIHMADQAMYRAKNLGKNRVEIYAPTA